MNSTGLHNYKVMFDFRNKDHSFDGPKPQDILRNTDYAPNNVNGIHTSCSVNRWRSFLRLSLPFTSLARHSDWLWFDSDYPNLLFSNVCLILEASYASFPLKVRRALYEFKLYCPFLSLLSAFTQSHWLKFACLPEFQRGSWGVIVLFMCQLVTNPSRNTGLNFKGSHPMYLCHFRRVTQLSNVWEGSV